MNMDAYITRMDAVIIFVFLLSSNWMFNVLERRLIERTKKKKIAKLKDNFKHIFKARM